MANPGVRLLVAESHRLYAEAICQALEREFTVSAAFDAQMLLLAAPGADVIIVGGDLAGASGLAAVHTICSLRPEVHAIVIGERWTRGFLRRCWEAGARGFLTRQSSLQELMEAARAVLAGKRYTAPASLLPPITPPVAGSPALTERQSQVLQLVSEGLSAKEIAQRLHLSQRTVEFHKANIMRLLGLRSSPQMIRFAMEWPPPRDKKINQ